LPLVIAFPPLLTHPTASPIETIKPGAEAASERGDLHLVQVIVLPRPAGHDAAALKTIDGCTDQERMHVAWKPHRSVPSVEVTRSTLSVAVTTAREPDIWQIPDAAVVSVVPVGALLDVPSAAESADRWRDGIALAEPRHAGLPTGRCAATKQASLHATT
jgi:hypothetical protein